jgi:hypothetical protein
MSHVFSYLQNLDLKKKKDMKVEGRLFGKKEDDQWVGE